MALHDIEQHIDKCFGREMGACIGEVTGVGKVLAIGRDIVGHLYEGHVHFLRHFSNRLVGRGVHLQQRLLRGPREEAVGPEQVTLVDSGQAVTEAADVS